MGTLNRTVRILTLAVAAHDLFVKLDSYRLPVGTPVQIPIINGTFQSCENSMTPDRVADLSLVTQGRRTKLSMGTWNAEGDSTFYGLQLPTGDVHATQQPRHGLLRLQPLLGE